MKVRLVVLGCGLILALAACGVRGALERPAPMFGKARTDYVAAQERAAAEKAAREAAGEAPAPPAPEQPIPVSPVQAPVIAPQGVAPPIPPIPAR